MAMGVNVINSCNNLKMFCWWAVSLNRKILFCLFTLQIWSNGALYLQVCALCNGITQLGYFTQI